MDLSQIVSKKLFVTYLEIFVVVFFQGLSNVAIVSCKLGQKTKAVEMLERAGINFTPLLPPKAEAAAADDKKSDATADKKKEDAAEKKPETTGDVL
jgi:hypothetical protein